MSFASLGLSPSLLQALTVQSYTTPTPIQQAAIPAALQGRDVLATAQTGSGKTVAFGLPLLQHVEQRALPRSPHAQALVLVPTRELCSQVAGVLKSLAQCQPRPPRIAVLFGGVSINPQLMALRGGAEVVVATPGRLLDVVEHNALSLACVHTLVLDEADRLLDLGFSEELERIRALLPARRHNLFFSATFAPTVQALAQQLLQNPVRVDVPTEPHTAPDITQRAIAVDAPRRTQLLRHLVTQEDWAQVLVFVATKHAAEIVADKLRKADIRAEPFHGTLSQGKRTQVLADFKSGRVQVVVATDVAARGLDIAGLSAVVNYDLPRSAVDYIHRIGRTGRAGQAGVALSFVSADMQAHFRLISKRHQLQLALEQVPGFEPAQPDAGALPSAQAAQQPAGTSTGTGGIKGKRPSKKDKLRQAAARQQGL